MSDGGKVILWKARDVNRAHRFAQSPLDFADQKKRL